MEILIFLTYIRTIEIVKKIYFETNLPTIGKNVPFFIFLNFKPFVNQTKEQ